MPKFTSFVNIKPKISILKKIRKFNYSYKTIFIYDIIR